jgi:hypothetical protein
VAPLLASLGDISANSYGFFSAPLTIATGFVALQTVTVPNGGSSSISFTSIPQTYSHLQIRIMNLGTSATQDLRCRFNGDTNSNYWAHYLYGNGSTTASGSTGSNSYVFAGLTSISTSAPQISIVDVLDYTNVNKFKTTRTLAGTDGAGSGYMFLYSGLWSKAGSGVTSDPITQIDLSPNSGSFNQYSSFALYGII